MDVNTTAFYKNTTNWSQVPITVSEFDDWKRQAFPVVFNFVISNVSLLQYTLKISSHKI